MPPSRRLPLAVRKAIGASSSELYEQYPCHVTRNDRRFAVSIVRSSELTPQEREAIWNIVDTNMRHMSSKSSMGWHPNEKQQELFHTDSRFIILRLCVENSDSARGVSTEIDNIVGLSMFRFDYEDGEKLLYCYEVQLLSGWRGLGLGRFLVHELIRIGKAWKMDKVMLTVLKVNQGAARLYRSLGFALDPSSPDYDDEDDGEDITEYCDYEILSISV